MSQLAVNAMSRKATVAKELSQAIGELDEISSVMSGELAHTSASASAGSRKGGVRKCGGGVGISNRKSTDGSTQQSPSVEDASNSSPGAILSSAEGKKAKLPSNLPISKKSKFWFLPPHLEKQLTTSRESLERQKKAFDDTFLKLSSIEKKKSFK